MSHVNDFDFGHLYESEIKKEEEEEEEEEAEDSEKGGEEEQLEVS